MHANFLLASTHAPYMYLVTQGTHHHRLTTRVAPEMYITDVTINSEGASLCQTWARGSCWSPPQRDMAHPVRQSGVLSKIKFGFIYFIALAAWNWICSLHYDSILHNQPSVRPVSGAQPDANSLAILVTPRPADRVRVEFTPRDQSLEPLAKEKAAHVTSTKVEPDERPLDALDAHNWCDCTKLSIIPSLVARRPVRRPWALRRSTSRA